MSGEEWRDIPYAPGYSVSNRGRVRSPFGRFIGGKSNGYIEVTLCPVDAPRTRSHVHRLVLEAFSRPPEEGEQANHINGNKGDNRIENLEWCTPAENLAHARRIGLMDPRKGGMPGEAHPAAKLTEDDVIEIRRLREDTDLYLREIGERFGVTKHAVYDIVQGRSWAHV